MHLLHIFPEKKLAENIPSTSVFKDKQFPFPSYLSVLSPLPSLSMFRDNKTVFEGGAAHEIGSIPKVLWDSPSQGFYWGRVCLFSIAEGSSS